MRSIRTLLTTVLAAWLPAITVWGQSSGPVVAPVPTSASTQASNGASGASIGPTPNVPLAEIEALRLRLETEGLTDEQRQQVQGLLQQAQEDLAVAEKQRETAHRFQELKLQATSVRDALLSELANLQKEQPREPARDLPLTELEAGALERRQEWEQSQAELESHIRETQQRPGRRETLRNTLFGLAQPLAEVKQSVSAPAAAGDPPLVAQAVQLAARARQQRLERTIEAAQNELGFYDAEDMHDLPRLRRERLERLVALRRREVQLWEARVQDRREDAIARRISEAMAGADQAAGDERLLYEENLALAQREREVRDLAAAVRAEARQMAESVIDLQRRFDQLRDRERKAAGSTALALRLRQQRELLRDPTELRRAVAARIDAAEETRLDALDKRDQLEELGHLEAFVTRFVAVHPAPPGWTEDQWGAAVETALEQRKTFLAELVRAYDAYTDALDELEREQLALADLTESVAAFIDERVLWIRSHRLVGPHDLTTDRALLAALELERWAPEVMRVVKADLWHKPGWYGLGALGLALLYAGRRGRRRRLEQLAQRVTSRLNVELTPTLQALAITVVLALFWPAVVGFAAWRLALAAEATPFTRSLAHNLGIVAVILLLLEFTRHLVRVDGLADAHFDWSDRIRSRLLTWVRRLTVTGTPILAAVALLNALHVEMGSDAWQRVGFAAVLLLLAWGLRDLMHPRTGVLVDWVAHYPGGWLDRLRPVWTGTVVAVPTVLAGLALYGYYYTAQQLAAKLLVTLAVLEGAVVIRGVVVCWLVLQRKRAALEQARARRAARAEGSTSPEESILRLTEAVEPKPDLTASSTQSHRLVNTSTAVIVLTIIWFVWADVLPALNYFHSMPVWPTADRAAPVAAPETPKAAPPATGAPPAASPPGSTVVAPSVPVPIHRVTWADLIHVLMVSVLTITAARNVPGLLEITLLQRLPFDAAMRYALQAFARYAIVLVGVVVISNLLGVDWASVQWLAAALTFGLAFGLQEIFANFVSGLIILSEQPVRVGDVVTIDEVTGVVSRIRIRSTTITDWDRKEYIVPNKEFITGKLLNWTLSDTLTRVVIPIGTAYNVDPEHVRNVILEVARQHDNVLADPPPVVTLDNFGHSALNFTLRVYLPDLKRRLDTVHELHSAILRRFRAEGIEIPYPQQDLHLRSFPEEVSALVQSLTRKPA